MNFSPRSTGTLSEPSLQISLQVVSKVFHRHMTKADGVTTQQRDQEYEKNFDVDKFLKKEYHTCLPVIACNMGYSVFSQRRKRSKAPLPTQEHVHKFIKYIFLKLQLNVECSIVALIYTERLMDKKNICLTPRNWRPILIAGVLTASKVWDDLSCWNTEFAELFPVFGLQDINQLESIFLAALEFNLFINGSEYAKYYFALRGLMNTKGSRIPRYYCQLNIGVPDRRIEDRTLRSQEKMKPEADFATFPLGSGSSFGDSVLATSGPTASPGEIPYEDEVDDILSGNRAQVGMKNPSPVAHWAPRGKPLAGLHNIRIPKPKRSVTPNSKMRLPHTSGPMSAPSKPQGYAWPRAKT